MTIHSFRRVLKVRRHIYAIPWNPGGKALVLPVPVPLLGLGYFAALEVLFLAISQLPVVGVLSRLPFWLWWVIPFWLTYLALTSSFDGRMPHRWARSWIGFRLRPKRTRGGLPITEGGGQYRTRMFMDEHAPDLHRSRITGPATARFSVPVIYQLAVMHRYFEVHPDARAEVDRGPYEITDDRLEIKR